MFSALKDHPFAVVAELERTIVLAYAAPAEQLRTLVPSCLELDLFQERWGFVAVAIVRTTGLRPAGFPAFMGQDFWLVGYRIFVRFRNSRGKRLRGLYILGSETDRRRMAFLGNAFTHYRYRHVPLHVDVEGCRTVLTSSGEGASRLVIVDDPAVDAPLPATSVFNDRSEARRFVGPLPFTFGHDAARNRMLTVEGSRTDWVPRPVVASECSFPFLDRLPLPDLRLANAFTMDHIPYRWGKGTTERLAP